MRIRENGEISMLFEREEKKAILILAGVIITLFLAQFIISGYERSDFAEIYSNESDAGDMVILSGPVLSVEKTKSGGHLILSVSGVKVFIPGAEAYGLSVKKGDNIEITGTVDIYNGEKEIVVDSKDDIRQRGSEG